MLAISFSRMGEISLKKLILGSSSPRRQELLQALGIPFTIRKPNIDESTVTLTNPVDKVEKLAEIKAKNIQLQSELEIVLAADTIVAYDGEIFEKPQDRQEAFNMIQTLSGTKHDVITAVALRSIEKEKIFSVTTAVHFWKLSDREIKAYVDTSEPYDKAGGYGIQGKAGIFVEKIIGDYFNVVGLPISYVVRELQCFGFPVERYIYRN